MIKKAHKEMSCCNTLTVALSVTKAKDLVFRDVELHVRSPRRLQWVSLHVCELDSGSVALHNEQINLVIWDTRVEPNWLCYYDELIFKKNPPVVWYYMFGTAYITTWNEMQWNTWSHRDQIRAGENLNLEVKPKTKLWGLIKVITKPERGSWEYGSSPDV